ncbi:acylphosphatase [Croceibacterium aestuarii]|uniref:acylphosphatase n=1 Tax=Croceibacterium aestuarii TaxID=3064139 RepID=UPI00272E0A42|nr:acylphosphatase [Croceibacterium sp. D39]
MTALDLVVHGRVQGVFYRDWTVRTARELGLAGWVRNEGDGTVAAHIEGEPQAVEAMVARMRDGPPRAAPTRIEQREVAATGLTGFERR